MRVTDTYDQDMLLDPDIPISWRHINKLSGSGALGDLGSHMINVLLMIIGDIDEVIGTSETVIKERPEVIDSHEKQEVENEDVIQFLLRFNNGAIGSSRIATGRKNYFAYEIQGTEGTVYYDLERLNEVHVYFRSDDGPDMGFRRALLNPNHGDFAYFL